MNGNSEDLVPRTSSSFENVARNWFERLSVMRLLKSKDHVFTRLSIEYMELAYDMELAEVRELGIREPPSMEDPLGLFHALLSV